MSDSPSTPTGASQASAGENERRGDRHERWIDRLRQRLGFRSQPTIRQNLEEVLEDNAPAAAGFTPEERSMLRNILELRESRAGDLALPRADIVAVQKDAPLSEVLHVFEEAGHTRLVVFDDTLDDPVGMVHIKDLVAHLFREARKAGGRRRSKAKDEAKLDLGVVDLEAPLGATKLIRPLLFVPPSMPALDLLERMQATRMQLALVVDEYGGTDGMVTVKDIVESIVGDIDDEHDEADQRTIVAQEDGSFIADGRAMLDELREALGPDFEPGAEATEEVETLGGYLTVLAGHVPVRGEVVAGPVDFEFEVMDADPRRVKKVKVHRGRGLAGRPRVPRRREASDLATATSAPASGGPPAAVSDAPPAPPGSPDVSPQAPPQQPPIAKAG